VRLSCVLVRRGDRGRCQDVRVATSTSRGRIGVDRVIFRQLMQVDEAHRDARASVVRFSDRKRRVAARAAARSQVSGDARFTFVRQIVGYYYYVEVWRLAGVDVVFEEADLARLEDVKRADPSLVHELVFHPDGKLASTWQPWDGVLSTSGTTTHPTL
jgi:cyclic pyranopterin phosphate synthase